jgi:hypothetical protein
VQSCDCWPESADVEALVNGCVPAVEAFLEDHPEVADTPEAAAALAAGAVIDSPLNSATSKSMMIGRFLDSLELLRAMSPDRQAVSPLDEIKRRRDGKLGRAKSKNRVDPAGEASS